MARPAAESAPVIPPVRWLLHVAAVLVFLAGVELFVFPLRTAEWFAWTVDPPMTAVFLGAAYWASAVLEVAGARARTWHRARLAVWPVFVFTTLTLGVTLLHLDRFHLGPEHPFLAQAATWAWLAIYAGVPVAMLVVVRLQRRSATPAPGTTPALGTPAAPGPALPAPLRLLLAAIAVVLVAFGVALLAVPLQAATLWPWPLTELTARAVGAWLVGLGWAAGQGQASGDARAVRLVAVTSVVFVLLQAVALVRHGGALTWPGPAAVSYVVALLVLGLAGGWALAASRRAGAGRAGRT